ncbi:phage terminase small subunit P27 family [Paraburkholderia bonniea]|uniref:phage terminase small subunit P27 family n=1 Tax=Paraburkholderia bonniea TaxID=2152891 RepID=UPI001290B04D|nr:phage terminase small subunit P27 family [Paraburkholderia bonniea]WJF91992.1 phage terminase small subunit P27 family [Paraburkholderia bonniea]WJF95311.1 phage terminase small subunit P27 family [Paraburkholderia bonniea]
MAGVKGRSGRRAKPTAKKELAGNPGKRALNKDEPDYGLVTNIECPEWVMGHGKEMWERVAPSLCKARVMQVTDLHNLEIFCMAYDRVRLAEQDLRANGLVVSSAQGAPMKNPAATILNEASRQMATFGALLGLDPSSRQNIVGGGNKKADNPFGALLGG